MAYNKYISLGTVKKPGMTPGEVFVRKVESDKYILFRLTYEIEPQVIGLTVPATKEELISYNYLSKEEAKKLN